jgi:uncharacterized membrane protein
MGLVQQGMTVNAPVAVCYQLWRGFEQFPFFMKHVKAITRVDDANIWRWEVEGPLGMTIAWDMRLDRDVENKELRWHSLEGSPVQNTGQVRFFAVDDHTTRIHLSFGYEALGHAEVLADWLNSPERLVAEDMQRFKQLAERQPHPAAPPRPAVGGVKPTIPKPKTAPGDVPSIGGEYQWSGTDPTEWQNPGQPHESKDW